MFFYRTKHYLFLDIGHYLAKAAYVTYSGRAYTIKDFQLMTVPAKTYENATITHPLKFKELIHQLLSKFPPQAQSGDIHLVASDKYTFLKKISIPKPLPKNLDQHMLYEAEQMAPYSMAEALVTYSVMDDDPYFKAYVTQDMSQVLTTISKQSILGGIKDIFEEIDHPLTAVSPGSIGLFNVGLYLLQSKETERLAMVHVGDQSTLLLYLSPQHVRFMYYPTGILDSIHGAIKQCDLTLPEGRYFTEHLSEKNIPDVFLSAFHNGVSRFCESLGSQIVNLCEANPAGPIPTYFSGGALRAISLDTHFSKFSELKVTRLNADSHLTRKHIQLSPAIKPDDIATFFPCLIGHLEALTA